MMYVSIWTIRRATQNNVKMEFPTTRLNATDTLYPMMTVSMTQCVIYNNSSRTEAIQITLSILHLIKYP